MNYWIYRGENGYRLDVTDNGFESSLSFPTNGMTEAQRKAVSDGFDVLLYILNQQMSKRVAATEGDR